MQLRINVMREGRPAFAPFSNSAELERLAEGLYASGSEIPLTGFTPGYYTFSITVRDLNAPKDSPAWKGTERKAEFIVLTPKEASRPARPRRPEPSRTPEKRRVSRGGRAPLCCKVLDTT